MVTGWPTGGERLMAEAGIVAAIGVVVALLDPVNPGGMALGARLAFWIGGFLAAWLVFMLFARVGRAMAGLLGIAPYWGYLLAVPFTTIAVAFAVLGVSGGTAAMFGAGFAGVWLGAMVIGAGFFALFFAIYARSYRQPEPAASPDAPPLSLLPDAGPAGVAASALHQRLDPGFPAILALSAEDHYVRVIAADRSTLMLMTLAEAAALMPEGSGAQVHRSWWVARRAVSGHQRTGRDLRLALCNGTAAPVSRSRIAGLKAEGWFG